MPENNKLFALLLLISAFLSAALLNTAMKEELWREFWVTELHLLVVSVSLFFLLRQSVSKKK